MAFLTDESANHVHKADPKAKCKACRDLVYKGAKPRLSGLGKAPTISKDEEPLSKS